MKNVILLIIFTILLSFFGFLALKVIDAYLPAIQFFINPTHRPSPTEEALLKKADRNPSPSDFKYLNQQMLIQAGYTPYIEIGKCSPYPRVARVLVNTGLTFVNSDTRTHTITFNPKKILILKSKEKKSILLDFYRFVPIPYGYSCDSSVDPIGILFVVEK